MDICGICFSLVEQALCAGLIEETDKIYATNRLLALCRIDSFEPSSAVEGDIPFLLEQMTGYAVQNGIIEDLSDLREAFSAQVMDVFVPRPSAVNTRFYELYALSPQAATDYFYSLSCASNYIQTRQIAKDIHYQSETAYGTLDITINLSKPEKNPNDIAAASLVKSTGYPRCLLCEENEGYLGRVGHPARSNHRMIRMQLEGELWHLQYSPYSYYDEHCIVLAHSHREMKMERNTLVRLLSFVEAFPHYFVGSNADLPIVGGSILTHDHYQGGRYEFAMTRAEDDFTFTIPGAGNIACSVLKWPMTVIRLRGENPAELAGAAMHVFERWQEYSDPSVDIVSFTEGVPHNTITPIARKSRGLYELDIVLRNNRQSEEYPLGIFHPHEDVQHIKKENIGLIEVMGFAVLPARLLNEIVEVERYLLGKPNTIEPYHLPWAKTLLEKYAGRIDEASSEAIIRHEIGQKFLRVLEDAGVFKRTPAGQKALKKFLATLL